MSCPVFLMLSGGGITTLGTAIRFPVRLVESGPAGGAIFAAHIARTLGLDDVVSYDMGGTTAKVCLIDDGQPQSARTFEVARVYRFMKGSGLPLRRISVSRTESSLARSCGRPATGKGRPRPDGASPPNTAWISSGPISIPIATKTFPCSRSWVVHVL